MSRDHNQLMQRIDRYINCGYKEATGGQRIKLAMKKLVTKFRQVLVNLSESFLEMEGLEVEGKVLNYFSAVYILHGILWVGE